jgi:ubiquitin C-terminal hydrolase
LNIPDTSRVLTLNGVVKNYFSESSDCASMKCECCTHQNNCPQTGVCKPKAFASKKILVKSPDVLIVQINRFANMTGLKLKTTVWPDDILQLPTGDE